MNPWYRDLPGLLNGLWHRLETGIRGPGLQLVLATHARDGGPEARIVVLRAADRTAGTVAVHTDALSEKFAELQADPRASIHVWLSEDALQIRLRGRTTARAGAEVADVWAGVPETSRGSYGVTPAPGTPIQAADAYVRLPDPARFAVLTLKIAQIDAVLLTEDFHRRALFERQDGWRGTWLAP